MSNLELAVTAVVLVILFVLVFAVLMDWLETKFDQWEARRKK